MGGNIVFGQALFSTYYINMSIFWRLQSAIRIWSCCCILSYRSKVKWFGILYGAFICPFLPSDKLGWKSGDHCIHVQFHPVFPDDEKLQQGFTKKKSVGSKISKGRPVSQADPVLPSTSVRSAAELSWTVMISNFVSVPNATEIMSIARIICLRTNISKIKMCESAAKRQQEE